MGYDLFMVGGVRGHGDGGALLGFIHGKGAVVSAGVQILSGSVGSRNEVVVSLKDEFMKPSIERLKQQK